MHIWKTWWKLMPINQYLGEQTVLFNVGWKLRTSDDKCRSSVFSCNKCCDCYSALSITLRGFQNFLGFFPFFCYIDFSDTFLIYTCSVQKTNVYSNRIWGLSAMWIICNGHNDSFDPIFRIWFFQDGIFNQIFKI